MQVRGSWSLNLLLLNLYFLAYISYNGSMHTLMVNVCCELLLVFHAANVSLEVVHHI